MHHDLLHEIPNHNYRIVYGYLDTDTEEEEAEHLKINRAMLQIINYTNLFIQIFELKQIFFNLWLNRNFLNKLNKNKVAVDLVFVSFSIHIAIEIALLLQTEILDEKLIAMKYIRMESLLIIPLLFIKFTEILTLFDSISPFVDIVFKILKDIIFFMLIFCITIFMAANCFYLIGRN